jgi:predicted transcriptional regulator
VSILKVSIRQIKAARELLAWSQDHLARASGISLPTIKRLESADGALGGRDETQERIVSALEKEAALKLRRRVAQLLKKHEARPLGIISIHSSIDILKRYLQ